MTRSRSILLLLAAMCVVTSSRNISTRIQSDNTTCLLEMDGTDVLQELLKGDAVFINIKLLSFVDGSDSVGMDFYENTTVIDINRWVVAVGEIGELLLTFPFDFEFLSLGTLSLGVKHISLNVTSVPECFFDVDNEDKLNIIANSLQLKIDDNVKHDVCIERQLTRDHFSISPSCYYQFLQFTTYFGCWKNSDDCSIELRKIMKHSWHNTISLLSDIFTLYFIWFLVSYLCRIKPMNENGKEYLSLRTDLPMGPKYCLLYSGNQYKCIFILRWLILWALVGLLQFIPYIIANVLDSDSFYRRRAALKNIESMTECRPDDTFCQGNMFINSMYICLCFLLLIICLTCQVWFETYLRSNFSNLPNNRRSMDVRLILYILKLPKNNYSGLYKLSFEMKERIKLIVSGSHWKDGLNWFWECFTKINNIGIHVTMFFILLIPFLIVYGMLTICLSVPIIYLTMRISLLTLNLNFKNSIHKSLYLKKRLVTLMSLFAVLGGVYVMMVVQMTKVGLTIAYIFNIIWYFYIGLLVNPGTAGVVAVITLIVIGYVISIITGYYKGYVVLFQQVISAFDELIKDNKVQVSGDKLPSFPQFKNKDDEDCFEFNIIEHSDERTALLAGNEVSTNYNCDSLSDQTSTHAQSDSPAAESAFNPQPTDTLSAGHTSVSVQTDITIEIPSLPIIRQDTEGLIAIEKTFFDTIVTKYRPPETQLLIIIMQLLILSLVIWVGFSTLKFIDNFNQLKQVKLYAAVFIAGIVPLFEVILRNKAEEESKKRILEKCIRQDVKEYLAVRERTTQTTAV